MELSVSPSVPPDALLTVVTVISVTVSIAPDEVKTEAPFDADLFVCGFDLLRGSDGCRPQKR